MSDLFDKFFAFNAKHQLVQANDRVLVAVSGGVDSVVLLHLMSRLARPLALELQVVHVNHGLRGEQAERDQEFVAQLAASMGLPFIVRKVNVPGLVARRHLSEETAARWLRYRCFQWALKKTHAAVLALGHQADDQVETVIDHFLRGSGVKGLRGMPVRRGNYIRPLLFASRQEIETYAQTHSLDYQIDSTNLMTRYRRNRIRHQLIPLLQSEFNPAIAAAVLRTARIMGETEAYLNEQARLALNTCLIQQKIDKIILDIDAFLSYFIVIQKYMLFQLLDRVGIARSTLTSTIIDRMLRLIHAKATGRTILLPRPWQMSVASGQIVLHRSEPVAFDFEIELNQRYDLPGSGLRFWAELIPAGQLPAQWGADPRIEFVDYHRLSGQLRLRTIRAGDRFRPVNFSGEKKISDFLIDLKIPRHQRLSIPLLVCDEGIVWILGYRIDDRFKITKNTQQVLKLQIVEDISS